MVGWARKKKDSERSVGRGGHPYPPVQSLRSRMLAPFVVFYSRNCHTVDSHIRHIVRKGILYEMAYIFVTPDVVRRKIECIRHNSLKGDRA